MGKRSPAGNGTAKLTGVDHLFGRDLRQGGWFVDEGLVAPGAAVRRRAATSGENEYGPDPAIIWALRNRRRG